MVFFVFSLAAVLAGLSMLVSTYGITGYLEGQGEKIRYWDLRSKFGGYLRQYRKMTMRKTGKIGSYYYIFLTSAALGVLWLMGVVIVVLSRR